MAHNDELFNVVQFFLDGTYEYLKRKVTVEEALTFTHDYLTRPAVLIGVVTRLIITDSGDCCVFEWQFKKGITFPESQVTREWNERNT